MNRLDQTLAHIAREVPGATAVFHRHQLDFCCGGKQTLQQAAQQHQKDPAAIAEELSSLDSIDETPANVRWAEAPDAALVEHILSRYHDVHREQLPELTRLSKRVELVHGGHPACPAGLTAHLEIMQQELEAHMRKEEEILFPMITRGMRLAAVKPIEVMRHDHDDHGAALQRLEHITHGLELPEGACNTWRALYLGLSQLAADLREHIHLENNILFERIEEDAREVQHG